MNAFHVMVHHRPTSATVGPVRVIGGAGLPTLRLPPNWTASALPLTFDEAASRLAVLPRMFVEPDGSFLWVAAGPIAWQLEGMLWDQGPQLSHLELKGTCESGELSRLLQALRLNPRELMFQSVADGWFLDDEGFFALAAGDRLGGPAGNSG